MSDAKTLLAKLVSFASISDVSNLPLIHFIRDYLAGYGVASRLSYNQDGTKANLFATIGQGAGGIVLSGHTDVVPVAGQSWSSDPFTLVERDGKLFGRGTSDMKSFVALALALVPEMLSRPLAEPIHLAFTYEEEIGCFGAQRLLEDLAETPIRPRLAIIGEPTLLRVINAHKGVFVYRTDFQGVAAHSSQPQRGASAIMAAGRFLAHLAEQADAARQRAPTNSDFTPPWTSFNAGIIQGGNAMNIIPGETTLHWEFRPIPGEDTETLEASIRDHIDRIARPALQAEHPDADILLTRLCAVPAFAPAPDSAAEKLVMAVTGHNRTGTVAFGTEAGMFQRSGIPAVICGPGSIDQAHQPDEFISLEQLALGEEFLRKILDHARILAT